MGFMEKVGATLATKYGTVVEGKHKGTIVALGNDPSQKSGFTNTFSQIIFLDGTEEKGRYDISENFKMIRIEGETKKGLMVQGLYNDGEKFTLELEWKAEDSVGAGLLKSLIGAKKTNATEQEKVENKYRPIKTFMSTFFGKLSPDSAKFLLDFYRKHDILSDLDEEFLNKLIDAYKS